MIPPRRADNGVFKAAALLVVLVTATTLLLWWAGTNHPLSFLKNGLAQLTGNPLTPQPPSTPKAKHIKEKEHARATPPRPESHVAATDQKPHADVAPVIPDHALTPAVPSNAAPVALPANAANGKVLKDLLSWIIKSGQSEAESLSFAPLPSGVAEKVLKTVYALQ